MRQPAQDIRNEILQTIQKVLSPWVQKPTSIREETNLITEIGIDSVGILQVILQLENEYQIEIMEHELDSEVLTAVSNFINLVKSKIDANC